MIKEKTAMHILIEELESMPIDTFIKGCVIKTAKRLLKKEQEQIEQAFDDGYDEASVGGGDYYQSKYGGE